MIRKWRCINEQVGVKKVKCIKDVVMIAGRTNGMFRAFTENKEYEMFFEDTGDIWTYNDKGNDHVIKDFENNEEFFIEHFEVVS